jgi:leishmanolysin-like peptidase
VIEEPEQVGAVYYTDAHPFAGTEALPAGHPAKSPRRILSSNSAAESEYQALRVVPVPISQSALTTEQATFNNDILMPTAVAFFADTLKVFPVPGPLGRDYFCNSMYTHTDPYKCAMDASTNARTCGDFILPDSHLTGKDQFGGAEYCTSATSAGYSSCTTYPNQGGGVPNADFVIYVGAQSVGSCPSSQGAGTLAFASSCQSDQYNRPTMGYVNFW